MSAPLSNPTVRAIGIGLGTALAVAATLATDGWSLADTFATAASFVGSVFGVTVPLNGSGEDKPDV